MNNAEPENASGTSFDLIEKSNELLKLLNSKASSQIKDELEKVMQFVTSQQGSGLVLDAVLKVIESIFNITKESVGNYSGYMNRFLDFFNFFNGEFNMRLLMKMDNDKLRMKNLTEKYQVFKRSYPANFRGKPIDQKKIKEIILNKLNKAVAVNEMNYNSSTNAYLNKYLDLVTEFGHKFKQISEEFANSV